jgi:hypothetical protein
VLEASLHEDITGKAVNFGALLNCLIKASIEHMLRRTFTPGERDSGCLLGHRASLDGMVKRKSLRLHRIELLSSRHVTQLRLFI